MLPKSFLQNLTCHGDSEGEFHPPSDDIIARSAPVNENP
jgi:hypothetical protein